MEAAFGIINKKFRGYDFKAILKLVKEREVNTHMLRLDVGKIIGAIITIALAVLKLVPKSFVEELKPGSYESFEKTIFFMSLTVIAYLVLVIVPTWVRSAKIKLRKAFIINVLNYINYRSAETQ